MTRSTRNPIVSNFAIFSNNTRRLNFSECLQVRCSKKRLQTSKARPRSLLNAFVGVECKEDSRNRSNVNCCLHFALNFIPLRLVYLHFFPIFCAIFQYHAVISIQMSEFTFTFLWILTSFSRILRVNKRIWYFCWEMSQVLPKTIMNVNLNILK